MACLYRCASSQRKRQLFQQTHTKKPDRQATPANFTSQRRHATTNSLNAILEEIFFFSKCGEIRAQLPSLRRFSICCTCQWLKRSLSSRSVPNAVGNKFQDNMILFTCKFIHDHLQAREHLLWDTACARCYALKSCFNNVINQIIRWNLITCKQAQWSMHLE